MLEFLEQADLLPGRSGHRHRGLPRRHHHRRDQRRPRGHRLLRQRAHPRHQLTRARRRRDPGAAPEHTSHARLHLRAAARTSSTSPPRPAAAAARRWASPSGATPIARPRQPRGRGVGALPRAPHHRAAAGWSAPTTAPAASRAGSPAPCPATTTPTTPPSSSQVEAAKRRLVYQLHDLGLPIVDRAPGHRARPGLRPAVDPVRAGDHRPRRRRHHHRPGRERRRPPRAHAGPARRALPHGAGPPAPRGRPPLLGRAGRPQRAPRGRSGPCSATSGPRTRTPSTATTARAPPPGGTTAS